MIAAKNEDDNNIGNLNNNDNNLYSKSFCGRLDLYSGRHG